VKFKNISDPENTVLQVRIKKEKKDNMRKVDNKEKEEKGKQ
jgi:hypothetical protein